MSRKFIFIYRILLLVLAFTGVYLEISKYGWGMLMYYTVLSNLLVLLFTAYLAYLMAGKKGGWENPKLLRIKGGITMCIMITCVIYHFMLAPLATDFYRLENFLCHYIVPLIFLFDTLFFDRNRQFRWFDPMLWTLVPLLYMGFALLNGFFLKLNIPDSKDSPFPYFFLNVPKHGWGYVLQWSVKIFLGYLIAGYAFYAVKTLLKNRESSRQLT